jgi:hypothetical protein
MVNFQCCGGELWRYPGETTPPIEFKKLNGIRLYCKANTCIAKKYAHKGHTVPTLISPDGMYIPGIWMLCNQWHGQGRILEDEKLNQEDFCEFVDRSVLSLHDIK